MTRRTATRLAPALVPGLLMLVIGLIGAGRPVLSWDEIATADAASRTPGQIWRLLHHVDGVFGPYYYLEHFWTGLAGSSEVALRFPSILAMAGTAALAGELGRRLYGPGAGVLAGVLLCLLPNVSRYAAEARPYALACFFSLLALVVLHTAVRRSSWRWWAFYGLAVVLVGLAHLIALTTLAAHVVVLGRHASRRTVKRWAAAAGVALLALAPMFWVGVHQRDEQLGWVPPLSTDVLWHFPGDVAGSVPAGWLLIGFALLALCRPLPHRAELFALAAGPVVTVGLLSVLVAPYWVARYLLVVLAPLAVLAAAGLRDVLAVPPRRVVITRPVAAVPPARALALVSARSGAASSRAGAASSPVGTESSRAGIASSPAGAGSSPAGATSSPAGAGLPARGDMVPAARRPHVSVPAGRRTRGRPRALHRVAHLAEPRTPVRVAAVLVLLLWAVYPAQRAARTDHAKSGSDYRTAAAIVERNQLPGDAIVYSADSRTMRTGLSYYLRHDVTRPLDVLLSRSAAEVALLKALEFPPTTAGLAHVTRLWLFVYGVNDDPLAGRPDLRRAFAGDFRLASVWFPRNATLALYTRDR